MWEYYTPKNVADIMWKLAYKHKSVSKFDRVLENSVGVGAFVNSCPLQVGSMDCYDISKYAIANHALLRLVLLLHDTDEFARNHLTFSEDLIAPRLVIDPHQLPRCFATHPRR